ncbi:protein piccolo isoform X2 [Megalobrama amblycephala]|nr:protein piccolo isoform X2 [Megalobrama amblycephala]
MPQTVTWICPVELREKEVALGKDSRATLPHRPLVTKITPGQFLLPVVSSSITAFKVLKAILKTHKPKIQFSGQETEVASQPSIRDSVERNAIIVFNGQIFLSVRKSRCRQVRLQNSPSAPSGVCPVSPSQQHQINTASSCQAQPLPDTSPRSQQSKKSEAPSESRATSSPPKPPEDLESIQEPSILQQSQIIHSSSAVSPSCQAQPLPDTSPRSQQSKTQDGQAPVTDLDTIPHISPKLHEVSEEMPEQSCMGKECQKEGEEPSESRAASSLPKPPEDLESIQEPNIQSQIIHASSTVSDQPEAAGGERETYEDDNERLEAALLPRAESFLEFDFEQLAHEEKINNLRARLRKKEAALGTFNSKPMDQI